MNSDLITRISAAEHNLPSDYHRLRSVVQRHAAVAFLETGQCYGPLEINETTESLLEITMNPDNTEIEIADLGVTMRTLLGIAGKRLEEGGPRVYSVKYKNAFIGTVRVKPFVGR